VQLTTLSKYRTAAVRSGPLLSSNDPQIPSEVPFTGFHASENICSAPVIASRPRLLGTADEAWARRSQVIRAKK
jgi:hypothetical protein